MSLIYDLPAADYHAHKVDGIKPLSSTFAKNLVTLSPLEAKWQADNPRTSDAFTFGTAVHELVLEGGLKTLGVVEAKTKGTKAWDAEVEALEPGISPIKRADFELAVKVAEAVRSHPVAAELLAEGKPEVTARVNEDGINLQARFDWLNGSQIVDLKTTASTANPSKFNRTVADFGYHVQAAAYLDIARMCGIENPSFFWIVASKTEPFTVSVVRLAGYDLSIGERIWNHAKKIYRECIDANHWPGYEEVAESYLPTWAERQADEITGYDELELKL